MGKRSGTTAKKPRPARKSTNKARPKRDAGKEARVQRNSASRVIRKTPDVLGGDARVGDRRIAVWTLVQLRQLGLSDEQIRTGYEPALSRRELEAAWQYYKTHPEEIDEAIRDNEES